MYALAEQDRSLNQVKVSEHPMNRIKLMFKRNHINIYQLMNSV